MSGIGGKYFFTLLTTFIESKTSRRVKDGMTERELSQFFVYKKPFFQKSSKNENEKFNAC